ncbi:MAG: hypothetical protein GX608_07430, partial [Lentisphaerae bacterium]|nr:hypothetical protein [Lentisphaerota bacterium]
QSLGLEGHAQLAIAGIKAGGRKEIGVRQAGFLSARDKFYSLSRRFNALAGRSSILRSSNFKDEPAALWPYLWEAGMTGIHQAWGEQDADPDKYVELVQAAGEFDLMWIDVLPYDGNTFGARQPYKRHRMTSVVEKPGADVVLAKYQYLPAFHGFWSEENYPDANWYITAPEFEAWLKNKYGADFRRKLGIAADYDLMSKRGDDCLEDPGPLKTEFLQACADLLLGQWRESQEWLGGLRKGCAFTFSVHGRVSIKFPGVAAKVGSVIAANGPEQYQCFGRFNSFYMEMHKGGEARPVMCEFYNWYSPSPAHDIRGFAQHLMHGECFYNFTANQIFGQATSSYAMWSWEQSRWENLKKILFKARKIREYLEVPASAANVGLVASELSYMAFYPVKMFEADNVLPNRWYQQQAALWTALNQSQIPTDIIWAEALTPEKLKRYRALVLLDARIVTPPQAEIIRDWVKAGGVLIAGGSTSLCNQWAEFQEDYQMADLFGVSYGGFAGVTDPEKIDTFC